MGAAFDSSFDSSFDIQVDDGPSPTTLGTGDDVPLDSLQWPVERRLFDVLDSVSRRYTQLVATAVSILRN